MGWGVANITIQSANLIQDGSQAIDELAALVRHSFLACSTQELAALVRHSFLACSTQEQQQAWRQQQQEQQEAWHQQQQEQQGPHQQETLHHH
ncbi:hypothetical protein ABBQ38_011874 [Trebouxia sp. C0009 RCD-2024]